MSEYPVFEYRHLTVAERLQLVEDIWDSIAADADQTSLPLSAEMLAELEARVADAKANPGASSPWPEVRARLLKHLD